MTVYLTTQQVVAINESIKGALARCDDYAGVDAAVGRASATYDGVDLLPTIWLKAASLLHGIASTQYFADGNKRTAFIAATLLLEINGSPLKPLDTVAKEVVVLTAATNLLTVEVIAEWFEAHALAPDSKIYVDDDRTTIIDGRILLADFAPGHTELAHLDAHGVTFVGPMLFGLVGGGRFAHCWFDYGPNIESMLYERIPGSAPIGAIAVDDCNFDGCFFSNVGFAGTRPALDKIRGSSDWGHPDI